MKIVGIVLIVCTCAGMGITHATALGRKKALWQAWTVLLERLYGELRYTALPIQELLANIERKGLEPLSWLCEYTDSPMLKSPKGVCAEEREFVRSFFDGLGTTDLEGQLHHIQYHHEKATASYKQASNACVSRSKAYVVTGVCAGLCLGLLMW